jgi:hypothetical protein
VPELQEPDFSRSTLSPPGIVGAHPSLRRIIPQRRSWALSENHPHAVPARSKAPVRRTIPIIIS